MKHLALNEILEISKCFNEYKNVELLTLVAADMEEKFNRYWTNIPYLYSFAFILDPQMRLNNYDILT